MSANGFLALPRFVALRAGGAGWLAMGLGALVALAGLTLLVTALARFRGQGLVGVAAEVAGPVVGRLLVLPLFLYFLADTALTGREFAENLYLALLPNTPVPVTAAVLLGLAGATASLGLETLVRAAMLWSLIIALFLVPLLASFVTLADFSNLTPLWGPGLGSLAIQGWKDSGLYPEYLLLGVVAPLVRRRQELWRAGALAIGGTWLVLASLSVLTVAVLSPEGAARLSFPVFVLARSVALGRFLERVEAVFVFLFFLALTLRKSVTLLGAAFLLAGSLDLGHHRPLVPALTVLAYGLSFVPLSVTEAAALDFTVIREVLWVLVVGLPLALLALAAGRRKGGGGAARSR